MMVELRLILMAVHLNGGRVARKFSYIGVQLNNSFVAQEPLKISIHGSKLTWRFSLNGIEPWF